MKRFAPPERGKWTRPGRTWQRWSRIADTGKDLLLAAIEAVSTIRPSEAGVLLVDLADSDDEEIAEAADEAMSMAEGYSEDEFDDEFGEDDDDDEFEGGRLQTIH